MLMIAYVMHLEINVLSNFQIWKLFSITLPSC
jgi:hypothetical protein